MAGNSVFPQPQDRHTGVQRMKSIAAIIGVALLFVVLFVGVTTVHAQEPAPTDNVDVVLLIDNSGSMRWNDPQDLRIVAAKLFIDLASPGDQIGIIAFSSQYEVIAPLTPITGPDTKVVLKDALRDLGEMSNTHMVAALEQAMKMLEGSPSANRRFVIFLTDGEPHPDEWDGWTREQRNEYIQQIYSWADEFNQKDYPVYPIALSQEAAVDLLYQIGVKTKSGYYKADTASELIDIYQNIFANLKDRYIKVFCTAEDQQTCTVTVGSFVRRISFVVFKLKPDVTYRLSDPNGKEVAPKNEAGANVFYTSPLGEPYEVVGIENPLGGPWTLAFSPPGSVKGSIVFESQLKLLLLQPQPVDPTNDSSARYHPKGKPMILEVALKVGENDYGGRADVQATVFTPGGARTVIPLDYDGKKATVELSEAIVSESGAYKVEIAVNTGKDQLAKTYTIFVEPLPLLEVTSPITTNIVLESGEAITIAARFSKEGQPTPVDSAVITATIQRPDHAFEPSIPLLDNGDSENGDAEAGDGIYSGVYVPEELPGVYEVALATQILFQRRPYRDSASTQFEISFPPILYQLLEKVDLGRVDDLSRGFKWLAPVASRAYEDLLLLVEVWGIPGVTASLEPGIIPARGSLSLELTITGPSSMKPGPYGGELAFSSRPEVYIRGFPRVPFTFEFVRPYVQLSPEELELGRVVGSEVGVSVPITLTSSSSRDESLTISATGIGDLTISPGVVSVPARQTVSYILSFAFPALEPGDHAAEVIVSSRPEVDVKPSRVPFTFEFVRPYVQVSPQELNLGRLGDLEAGVSVPIIFKSSSPRDESLAITVSGIENLTVSPGVVTVPARQTVSYILSLTFPTLKVGDYAAEVIVSSRPEVDVRPSHVPFTFEVVRPYVQLSPQTLHLGSIRDLGKGVRVPITLTSSSPRDESLTITVSGIESVAISPGMVSVPARQTVSSTLSFAFPALKPGDYAARVIVSSRPEIDVEPSSEILVTFYVMSFWEIWGGWIKRAGVVLALALVAAVAIRQVTRPPNLEGDLSYRKASLLGVGGYPLDLGNFGRNEVYIEIEPSGVDIVPVNRGNAQARLRAVRGPEGVTVVVAPISGQVYKGRAGIPVSDMGEELSHNDEFRMGDYVFRYTNPIPSL